MKSSPKKGSSVFNLSDTLYDQKSPALLVHVANGGNNNTSTDIVTYRLNRHWANLVKRSYITL